MNGIPWTPEEEDLLRSKYSSVGSNIPELLRTHNVSGIQRHARVMGLVNRARSPVILDGEKMTVREALKRLGLNGMSMTSARLTLKGTNQDVIDYLCKMHIKQEDGSYKRTVNTVFLDETMYIHFNDKLWSIDEYIAEFTPDWSLAAFRIVKSRQGLTSDEAVEYLNTRQINKNRVDLIALAKNNKNIIKSSEGYYGTNGVRYIFIICSVCHRTLLIPREVATTFTHGSCCEVYSLPEGIESPIILRPKDLGRSSQ